MNEEQLRNRVASLESINDQLQTEIAYIDKLMRSLGFTDGLQTVKMVAEDLYLDNEVAFFDDDND